ncbi:divalent-cation tolerance protein CutA [Planctomicrobium sp. SH661]|uniref:divalent-cation tolerance protein CutA n=1 Tax=Planctomicrobium sp. SH661 TaxID=3448124 RepID=UPI003F5C9BDB
MPIATIYLTLPSHESAVQMAQTLVTEKLIACANIIPGMTSIYEWEEKLEHSTEVAMLLKTPEGQIEAVTERIRSLHPYQCPCVVAWNSIGGNEEFFQWVHAQAAGTDSRQTS